MAHVGFSVGSSPRMRGTLVRSDRRLASHGIIPAYAGNTSPVSRAVSWAWDHPRVCGEHLKYDLARLAAVGSSPRMRGTLRRWPLSYMLHRIIPAYAGNTRPAVRSRLQSEDHPRVCGEHETPGCFEGREPGSSPRMRGTPAFMLDADGGVGIIPAYAGNTSSRNRV